LFIEVVAHKENIQRHCRIEHLPDPLVEKKKVEKEKLRIHGNFVVRCRSKSKKATPERFELSLPKERA
jgi:hypothetical protein